MKKFLLILGLILVTFPLSAKVHLGAPFGDGMVLQQNTKVKLWGKALPKSKVTLMGSWNYKEYTVQADEQGAWKMDLPTPKGSFTAYSLTLSDGKEKTVLRNILMGEVWFASGQSNMQHPMKGWNDSPVTKSQELIAGAGKYAGKLHFTNIPRLAAKDMQDSVSVVWQNCTPATVADFSVVAYYFASALIDKLQVPVGIINCSYGGSEVESWLPKNTLRNYNGVNISDKVYEKLNEHTPAGAYNAMVHPLIGYTIKGFIWYQGESNVKNSQLPHCNQEYAKRFSDMINLWRAEWGQKNLPFYFVEIAPYKYGDDNGTQAAVLREQQIKVQHTLSNTGMIGTNDIMDAKEEAQIHPANKQPVGQRLAAWALSKDYKQTGLNYKQPEFKSMNVKYSRAYLTFTNSINGFNRQEDIQGFEMCGHDSIFYPCKAVVRNNKVVLTADSVATPMAVRYCYKNFQLGNLANKEGIPVVPFRTDKFALKE